MARPAVSFKIGRGGLERQPPSEDGVAILVVTRPAAYVVSAGVFTSLPAAEAAGYTEALDKSNNALVWEHIKDFYEEAGDGNELHVLPLADTVTLTNLFTTSHASYATLQQYLASQQGKIKLIAVALNPAGAEAVGANGISTDLASAIPLAQAFCDAEAVNYRFVDVFLPARGLLLTNWSNLVNLRTLVATGARNVSVFAGRYVNRCATLVAAGITKASNYTAMGLRLGRAAKDPVNRSPGRVRTGPVVGTGPVALSGGTLISALSSADINVIHDRGFTFLLTHVKRTGVGYFNDDPACIDITSDYAYVNRSRTINKALSIAYDVYLEELNDESSFDPATGSLAPEFAKGLQAEIETAIEAQMVSRGELNAVKANVDLDQDTISTDRVDITLNLQPKGTNRNIQVTVGFVKSIA